MKPFLCAIEPSMEFETDYAIKLLFPNPTFTQIYFESVANALDAEATEITIHISSDGVISPTHLEITVSDNGIGFTDDRFARFSRVETPSDPYHKGFGRLVYLRVSPNVGQKNGLNKVVSAPLKWERILVDFRSKLKPPRLPHQESMPSLGPKTENRL